MTSCPHETDLGVYVLGTLDEQQRSTVGAHLADCASCRARHEELAMLPSLLGRLSRAQVEALTEPPPALLADRIVAAGRQHVAASRRRPALLVAAAALVLVAAGAGTAVALHDDTPAGVRVAVTDPGTHVSVQAHLVAHADGTQLRMSLWGVAPGTRCEIVAVSSSGRREVAATWVATYHGTAEVVGTTAIPRQRLQRLVVQTDSGQVLATMKV